MVPAFADRLRSARHERRLTQQALAERAGLRQVYISQLERGLRPRHPREIALLAYALGVSPEALIDQPTHDEVGA